MNCPNCKHPVKDGSIFCPYCGCKIDENQVPPNIPAGMNYSYTPPLQPTNALVIEGIGLFFFLIFFTILVSSFNKSESAAWGMVFGFIIMALSRISFKKFKKKYKKLVGIGYVGYIISTIACIISGIFLIFFAVMLIFMIISVFIIGIPKKQSYNDIINNQSIHLQEQTIEEDIYDFP